MGQISRKTYKKLTLLYFIGKFKDGVYSNYRVQKVLYFATLSFGLHPFPFWHTAHGQYSRDARENLDSLAAIELINITNLREQDEAGFKVAINPKTADLGLAQILARINPQLAKALDIGISEYGYLKRDDLKQRAHDDELLKSTPLGHLLFDENLPDNIDVDISEDECEDLDLALDEHFVNCMDHLVRAVEATGFNLGEVKIVDSIL